jgi:large subunit ribosomal protein L6
MSKIGKLPIEIKDGVTVTVADQNVNIVTAKGQVNYAIPKMLQVTTADGQLTVMPKVMNDKTAIALWGLTRANLANVIKGLTTGFEKKLELIGVGYRAQMQGTELVLSLGFAHPVKFRPMPGITMSVAENVITIAGIDKMLVGETAAKIRAVKPPEPYKGKGIKYTTERVRRKAGKAAKAVGGK